MDNQVILEAAAILNEATVKAGEKKNKSVLQNSKSY